MNNDAEQENIEDFPEYFTEDKRNEGRESTVQRRMKRWKKKFRTEKILLSDNANRLFTSIKNQDLRGEHVFLVDTGEELGIVTAMIYNEKKDAIGLKIRDIKSGTVLDFPIEEVNEEKEGLILLPTWYIKAAKTIDKIEFKERISPELRNLLPDDLVSNKNLYETFIKYDDEMARYMEEAAVLKKILTIRLKLLERQHLALKGHLIDLTEQRLMQHIDRRQFSERVMEQRQKSNIFDLNIEKCKELLQRLENTSFGILGKNIFSINKNDDFSFRKEDDTITEGTDRTYKDQLGMKQFSRNTTSDPTEEEIIGYVKKTRGNQLSSIQDTHVDNAIEKKLQMRDAYIKELLEELEKKNEMIHRLKNELSRNQR